MGLKTRAATFAGATPELKAVGVEEGAAAKTAVEVEGVSSQDIVVAAINLDTGATLTVEAVANGEITVTESTEEAAVLYIFWSVGLG